MPPDHQLDHRREALTHDYGREIFARLSHRGPVTFSPSWWDDLLMQWTMGDPVVKVQLVRFIDALPLLRSTHDINRHLREYFTEARERLPHWMQLGLRYMPDNGFAGNLLARTARWNAERLARRFIAGSNVDEA